MGKRREDKGEGKKRRRKKIMRMSLVDLYSVLILPIRCSEN